MKYVFSFVAYSEKKEGEKSIYVEVIAESREEAEKQAMEISCCDDIFLSCIRPEKIMKERIYYQR